MQVAYLRGWGWAGQTPTHHPYHFGDCRPALTARAFSWRSGSSASKVARPLLAHDSTRRAANCSTPASEGRLLLLRNSVSTRRWQRASLGGMAPGKILGWTLETMPQEHHTKKTRKKRRRMPKLRDNTNKNTKKRRRRPCFWMAARQSHFLCVGIGNTTG